MGSWVWRADDRSLPGRGHVFDLGSMTVLDRSSKRPKKPPMTLFRVSYDLPFRCHAGGRGFESRSDPPIFNRPIFKLLDWEIRLPSCPKPLFHKPQMRTSPSIFKTKLSRLRGRQDVVEPFRCDPALLRKSRHRHASAASPSSRISRMGSSFSGRRCMRRTTYSPSRSLQRGFPRCSRREIAPWQPRGHLRYREQPRLSRPRPWPWLR